MAGLACKLDTVRQSPSIGCEERDRSPNRKSGERAMSTLLSTSETTSCQPPEANRAMM
jgi:hypothetical protein